MDTINFSRAEQLLQQGRYDLAEKEFRKYLSSHVNDADAHAYLGLCLINLKRNKEALEEIKAAIAIKPDFSFAHYLLSRIYFIEDEFKKAEESIKEALRLDPTEAEYYESLAIIHFNKSNFHEALKITEEGLQMDPEHVGCLNLRARCLVKLNKKEYANESFEASFNKDPDNSYTHANQGWAFLEQGNYKGALTHFRESLRLEPNNEFAKSGLVEALKAKYLIYKWFLQFMFWAESLGSRTRWGMLIGFLVLNRLIPPLAPIYLAFVLFTWFLDVIFNSLLRFNAYGKHALNKDQRLASDWFLSLLALAFVSFLGYFFLKVDGLDNVAIVSLGMLFPISGTFRQYNKKNRKKSLYFTIALAIVGGLFIGSHFIIPAYEGKLLTVFLVGAMAYTWFANSLN